MTKKEAISRTIKEVNKHTQWCEPMGMWRQHYTVLSPYKLKRAKIIYALTLLGVDNNDASYYVDNQMPLEYNFRQAVYNYAL